MSNWVRDKFVDIVSEDDFPKSYIPKKWITNASQQQKKNGKMQKLRVEYLNALPVR